MVVWGMYKGASPLVPCRGIYKGSLPLFVHLRFSFIKDAMVDKFRLHG